MMKRVESAVSKAFPIESKKYVMEVRNLRWKEHGPSIQDNIRLQKDYKSKDKTLSADLAGDVRIRTAGGRTVDSKQGMVLVTLPHITNRASYIVNGHEVQTVNQLRLRPGPYSRFTSDDNTETFINAAGGGYRIIFNRQTGVLRLKSGSSFFYLYPILRGLGVSDNRMKSAWGDDIFEANKAHDKKDQMSRLYRKMRPYASVPEDPVELSTSVDSFFRSKDLDPKISKITMGKGFDKITPDLLVKSSQKAIDLAKGSEEADDTESLAFKSVHSVEDFIPERIEKATPAIQRAIRFRMDRTPKISALLSPSTFSNPVIDWFMTSEFTRYSDQQNPVDMASTSQLTTTMGEGGIRSAHAVTDQVRMVHPSQMGFLDPIHSPEGGRIGVTGHLTIGAEKQGTSLFTRVFDAKTGRPVRKSSQDLENAIIAFNDQYDLTGKKPRPLKPRVEARVKGKIQTVPASKVQYVFRDPRSFFSVTSNAIPFLHNNNPNRGQMADRHIEQTVPLTDPDTPVVQSKFQEKEGFDDFFGKNVNVKSPTNGTVSLVRKDRIRIRGDDRKDYLAYLHYQYPLNGGSFLTDKPIVKTGDRVKKGQVIAENNFTRGGSLALGKNLRTAYIPYKGYNFEDGVVISQSAAKKLTSEHQHQLRLDLDKNTRVGLDIFLAHFPDEVSNVDRTKYDRDGVIKKGSRVTKDEILVPAVSQTEMSEEFDYARLHKSLRRPWRNVSITWDSDFPATVVDTVKTSKFIKVFLRTEEAAQVGDKVSQRSGGKGIIVNILPDNEMLQGEDGKPMDVLFNPGGVTGRVNPGQLYEGSMGKVSRKTGEKYLVENFSPESSLDRVQSEMRKAKVKDTETLTDPGSGDKIPDIFTGDIHFLKLQHQVRNKFKSRGLGSYTTDEQPSKVGDESAQNIGSGELFALLASGAMHFLKDTTTLKSQSNPEYWRALQTGLPTPPPRQPFILDKFVTNLEGAGVNLSREGSKVRALPMTDRDVEARSKGEVKNHTVVRASDLKPEKGGLFDKGITGGYDGTHWSHINLETAMPAPLMEKALISVAGLKPAEYKAIMRGNLFVTKDGQLTPDAKKGAPAGEGLKILLDKINVDRELEETIAKIRDARGNKLDELNKKRRYLQALKSSKLTPSEAYITNRVPVIPPKFRPIYPLPDGSLNVADPNHGYREVLMINNQLKTLKDQGVDNRNLASIRSDLYGALQGLSGMTEPLTRSKNFQGFVATIKGRSNKRGLFQGRVVKRPQDLSGRSTIIPDPKLGIDEVGLPAEMGINIYRPFLVRRLVGLGYKPKEAMDLIDNKDPKVLDILREEAKERPVWLNRAPSLHKFSMLPFKPRIAPGKAIQINPLIVKGFNADFDGDTMGLHVPVSEEARQEAFEKMPSKQLLSVREHSAVHTPSKEYVLGLYLMTKPKGKSVKAKSRADMMSQFQEKKIKVNTPVKIGAETWTPGQALIDDVMPQGLKPKNKTLDKRAVEALIYQLAKKEPNKAGDIISKLKDLGAHYVTEIGYSFGLDDLKFDYKKRKEILQEASRNTPKMGFEKAHGKALDKMNKEIRKMRGNRIVQGNIESGAFGKGDMVTQMLATPVAVRDHKNEVIPVPINRSFAEGHGISSYWATAPGARKGLIEKGLGTAETGALSKRLINTTVTQTISMKDCGTSEGTLLPIESRDALDRFVADGPFKKEVITPELVTKMKRRGMKQVKVRSPLKCRATQGICAMCFGLLENGKTAPIGYNAGVLAGQAVSEPMTQLSLRAFHTGGAMAQKAVGFDRIRQVFEMPENLPGRAPLAQVSGKVESIEPGPGGGWNVVVGDVDHFVPQERGLGVKRGDRVLAGQKLSKTGVIRPQEMLAATNDIDKVRGQMVKDLDKEFSSGGVQIRKNLLESVVRPMTDRAEITDAGDGEKEGFYKGDVVSTNRIEEVNKKIRKKGGKPIEYKPTLLSIRVAPYHSGDFIGKLMFERPHQTIAAAPRIGAEADVEKGHPITRHTFGRYFGPKDTGGKKK